jgi:hypothetical protein
MLELNKNKCLAVLRAKVQWKLAAGQTKADKLIKFASGQSLLKNLNFWNFRNVYTDTAHYFHVHKTFFYIFRHQFRDFI